MEHGAATVDEYHNPQSNFNTKGISVHTEMPICQEIISHRDQFIEILLHLYEQNMLISEKNVRMVAAVDGWNLPLWFSVMRTENVLNPIPSRPGQYSLFRTHHTVNLVAERLGHSPVTDADSEGQEPQ
jgi:hypothetical protein